MHDDTGSHFCIMKKGEKMEQVPQNAKKQSRECRVLFFCGALTPAPGECFFEASGRGALTPDPGECFFATSACGTLTTTMFFCIDNGPRSVVLQRVLVAH